MARGLRLVFTNCTDPAREEEFNRWYSHTHLADLSAARGFVKARRFFNLHPEQGPSKYLALYEFESDDIEASVRDLQRLARQTMADGRHIDCLEVPARYAFQEVDADRLRPLERLEYPRGTFPG